NSTVSIVDSSDFAASPRACHTTDISDVKQARSSAARASAHSHTPSETPNTCSDDRAAPLGAYASEHVGRPVELSSGSALAYSGGVAETEHGRVLARAPAPRLLTFLLPTASAGEAINSVGAQVRRRFPVSLMEVRMLFVHSCDVVEIA